jgi:hypothetical protein
VVLTDDRPLRRQLELGAVMLVLAGCSAAMDGLRSAWTVGYIGAAYMGKAGQSVDWSDLKGRESRDQRRLLIRGFGVRVPGGAPA